MFTLLIFVTPRFPRAVAISCSVAKANSLLLMTPLEMLNLSWAYVLHLELRKLFFSEGFLFISGYPPQQASFHFSFSLHFLVLFALKLFFLSEMEKILARQTSSRDFMTMNLGKSAASFSESDSDKFLLVYFRWPCAPLPTTESNLRREWTKGESPFALAEMGIHNQYTHIKSKVFSLCKILVLKPYNLTTVKSFAFNTIDAHPPPSSTYKIKDWELFH